MPRCPGARVSDLVVKGPGPGSEESGARARAPPGPGPELMNLAGWFTRTPVNKFVGPMLSIPFYDFSIFQK